MITDDERREVVARLRERAGRCGFYGDELEDIIGVPRSYTAMGAVQSYNRLADLVEPPSQCPYYHSDRHYCSVHEDMQAIDRDALLALADEMKVAAARYESRVAYIEDCADRIREACGEALAGED